MQFLIDKSPRHVHRKAQSPLVLGQLLSPLTRYANWGGVFAIDNGAFRRFLPWTFEKLLRRNKSKISQCLFVTCPDVVGDAVATLANWKQRRLWVDGWPQAFVLQDGAEDMELPWDEMAAAFVGGCDPWKDSEASQSLVVEAKGRGLHTHIGRVNTMSRYDRFAELGADTCDGTGVSQYDHMLAAIEAAR